MSFTKIYIKDNVRIFLSDYTQVANSTIEKQKSSNFSSLILANAITIFGVLPFILQAKHGKVISFLKSNGTIKNLIVEANSEGEIKALIGNPLIEITEKKFENKNIPLILAIGNEGILRITRKNNNDYFTGEVKLVKSDLITDLAYYFQISEQIYTAIKTSVFFENENKFSRAYSVIFQLLPQHQEKDILWIENIIKNHDINNYSFEEYEKILNADLIKIKNTKWKCSCSKNKLLESIQLIDKIELEKILLEDKKIEIICDFCQTEYIFYKKDFE
ncbi:Hsp33 family molecular chaperone HslO [[Mycoplasma] collis]|uniref:Hsp33 family molecular chaperone HslO n=1 Tax=[Mycoplasma] collis TaxID=2127 RepID=UPI000691944F|nr:Hsp33 family molecular chaperone HslO [[Mycoplasma] collis]